MTVLIPAYNAEKCIHECICSVLCQRYPSEIRIIVVDDGSTDHTCQIVRALAEKNDNISLVPNPHLGKAQSLNYGLAFVKTMYFATLDSDTVLHEDALKNIVSHILQSGKVAVAGLLLPKNRSESYVTRMQMWDYSVGIFAVKLLQNFYQSTLVAQGAFSVYVTRQIRELGGWPKSIGEDIVLTYALLRKGFRTGFEQTAIAFTDVPATVSTLQRQRKRWARGMIEAFRYNRAMTVYDTVPFRTRVLIFFNLMFPFADLAITVFYPIGIILACFHNFCLVGPMTLMLIPMSLLLIFLIGGKFKKSCRQAHFDYPRRSIRAFLGYLLIYQFMLSPICLLGYLQEIFYVEKSW